MVGKGRSNAVKSSKGSRGQGKLRVGSVSLMVFLLSQEQSDTSQKHVGVGIGGLWTSHILLAFRPDAG